MFIKKINYMFKSHFINDNEKHLSYFKTYSNKLTKIKATAKKLYFFNERNKHHGNPKNTWDTLRFLLPLAGKTSMHAPMDRI